jgi:DNA-binding NarL/FixJ family response regulator
VKTLVIVDDNARFRAQARAMLQAEGFDVIGEAEDATTAVAVCRALRPEVVLVDVGLPDTDGFELTARLHADVPGNAGLSVVLTSSREASAYRTRISTTAARGFIPKDQISGAAITALIGVL